jgi:predicted  nucleic acid-binding Zn-ribbon protein
LPEPEQIAPILKKLGAIQERAATLNLEIEQINKNIDGKRKEISKLVGDATKVLEKTREANDAARVAEYCARSIDTLTKFRSRLIDARRNQLEVLIREPFQA